MNTMHLEMPLSNSMLSDSVVEAMALFDKMLFKVDNTFDLDMACLSLQYTPVDQIKVSVAVYSVSG